jgi:RNA polymerase sigma-70 factor (ECF subfamily)
MGTVSFDEGATWAAARGGDSAAFARVFDAHRDRVFGQALRLIREPHEAEDVTALVFFEAWRKRDSVRVVDGSILGWLLVTANNVVRNLARARRRHHALLDRLPKPENQADHADAVGERLDQDARDSQVRAALEQLSEMDQNIITRCVIEEYSTAEAAAVLGIPAGTVKSRLSRAKQRLGAHVGLADPTLSGGAK